MKKDPCETCIVRACCKIQEFAMWWKCGCDIYEIYKLWQHLSYSSIQSYNNARIMDRRMKQLKERYHEERSM